MSACPSCTTELPDSARFCFSCGAALTPGTCRECGETLVPGARFCSGCGTEQTAGAATTGGVAARPVSSRRVTSVLFGDLVGFTALAEHRDQEFVRELLARYFEECRQIISRYGGTVEKFIGDAVMAVWGVPTAHEDDSERAVRAGLELVNVVSALRDDLGVADVEMRVGIVTGEVAVTIGAEHQGMVAGDAVNTASRVQEVATPGQVWVDETTRLLTSSAITYVDAGTHHLKGKLDPVPLWSAQAVVAAVGGAQRADGLEAALVGRDRELRLVKELFHRVEESGRPSLLVLGGDPGTGKSRVAWEFEKYVDGLSRFVRWHNGRCVAYGEGLAYFALAEAIRGRLRTLAPDEEDNPAPDPGLLLERGLETFVEAEDERAWLRPRLGALLGIGSVGTFAREDLFSAWTVFLQRIGEDKEPVILVIDDAQNADDGLLQFVEHLLTVAEFPCFVLLLTRPGLLERRPGLATHHRATVIHLAVLSDADIARLLDGLVVGLPVDVRDALVTRSEGIPLFAVETVRSLIDRDLVVPRGGRYVLTDPDAVDLTSIGAPASLHALIAARLDALEPGQRMLVDRASVIGNVFSRDDIGELCPELGDVGPVLASLVRLQILGQLTSKFSAEFGQYQFVQTVVRQVAYATLSRRDRRALHLAVARQTEAVEDRAGELAPIIAQHYLDAIEAVPSDPEVPELGERAIAQLERAAVRARALGALKESAGHLLAALDLATDAATRARLLGAVAAALVDGGQYAETIVHARAAQEAFEELGDRAAAGLAAAAHGLALVSGGDNAGARALVEPWWKELLGAADADQALLALSRVLSTAYSHLDLPRREILDRSIQIAERVDDPEELAHALAGLSLCYAEEGASFTARTLLRAAADMARENHLPGVLARCLSNLSVEYTLADLDKAVATSGEAVEVAARTGHLLWHGFATANLLIALTASGRWDEVDERMAGELPDIVALDVTAGGLAAWLAVVRRRELSLSWPADEVPVSDDPSDEAWIAFAESNRALSEGRTEDALDLGLRATRVMFDDTALSDDFVHFWPPAVDIALSLEEHGAVADLLDLVDESASRVRIPLAIRAHRARFAALLRREEAPEEAIALLREAADGFRQWGSRPHRARTEAELGMLLSSSGAEQEGAPLLEAALATLIELGAELWVHELKGQLSHQTG